MVIVGSILLAFGIQAWWDGLGEARQRTALLEALSEDFVLAADSLASVKAKHALVAERSKQVLDYGEIGTVPVTEQDSLDVLIGGHFMRTAFDPPMGTVETILGSGRLDLLGSAPLVRALTKWSSQLAGLDRYEQSALDHFYERIYPYLAERLDLEDLDKGYAEFIDVPWDQAPAGAYRLVSDQEFLNIIYMHWVLNTNVLMRMGGVEIARTFGS